MELQTVTDLGAMSVESDGDGIQRPINTTLANEGDDWSFWLVPGNVYDLAFDGIGWVTTSDATHKPGHTHRIASLDKFPIGRLPMVGHGATFMLNLDVTWKYRIDDVDGGTWKLYVVG